MRQLLLALLFVAACAAPTAAMSFTTDGRGNATGDGKPLFRLVKVEGLRSDYKVLNPAGEPIGSIAYDEAAGVWVYSDNDAKILKRIPWGQTLHQAGVGVLSVYGAMMRSNRAAAAAEAPPSDGRVVLGPLVDGQRTIALAGQVVGTVQPLPATWFIKDLQGRSQGQVHFDAGQWKAIDAKYKDLGRGSGAEALLLRHAEAMFGSNPAQAARGPRVIAARRAKDADDIEIEGLRLSLDGEPLGRVERLTERRWVVRDAQNRRLGHLDVDGRAWSIVGSDGEAFGSVISTGRLKLQNGYSRSLDDVDAATIAAHAFFGPGAD